MAGSISLPQIVLDLEEEERKIFQAVAPPKSIVCRYGYLRLVAELPYDGPQRLGCGSKLVIRTERGIELAAMLTTTCSNGGCGWSVNRKQMLQYFDASGGRDYPFTTEGRVLRPATAEDAQEQARLDGRKGELLRFAKSLVRELNLPMKVIEVELLLGGERIIFHYAAEEWVDFRELVRLLAAEYQTRIEMHQVNARDEARLVADYEKCGQHCCCRQFLKVLKPVSMRSAKTQKATLDPTKISGRCGRLMCCLRFEDQTYEMLKKKLPHRQSRMMTPDGPGTVIDTQILTQLVLVALDSVAAPAAFPLEQLRPLPREEDPQFKAGDQGATGGAGSAGGMQARRDAGRSPDRGPSAEPRRAGTDANLSISGQPSQSQARADEVPHELEAEVAGEETDRVAEPGAAGAPDGVAGLPGDESCKDNEADRQPLGGPAMAAGDSDVEEGHTDVQAGESDSLASDRPGVGQGITGQGANQAGTGPQGDGGGGKRRRRRRRRRRGGAGPGSGGNPGAT